MKEQNTLASVKKEFEELMAKGEVKLYCETARTNVYVTKYSDIYTELKSTGKIIKRKKSIHKKSGYERVKINEVPVEVHKIVATCWVYNPNPEVFKVVDHISANYATNDEELKEARRNNDYRNLRWVTQQQNIQYAHEAGRFKNLYKKLMKLTFEQATEIRKKYATGNYKICQLANEYDVSSTVISNIVKMKSYLVNLDD